MKKTLLLLTLVFSLSLTYAQSVSFGVKGGLNLSTITAPGSGSSASSTGFHVGGFVDIGLNENWSIQPALLYTTKGGEQTVSGSYTFGSTTTSYNSTAKLKLNYIELPVNLLYNIPVGFGKIFLGGGPYAAYGVSGTNSGSSSGTGITSQSSSSSVKFGSSSTDDVKNPDYGINILGGVKLENGLSASLGYGFGLANLSTDGSSTVHNNVFSVSVGFSFL